MFNFRNKKAQAVISLGLEIPTEPKAAPGTPGADKQDSFRKAYEEAHARVKDHPAQQMIQSEAMKLVETGVMPEKLFCGIAPEGNGLYALPLKDNKGLLLPIFTSPFFARDFLRERRAGNGCTAINSSAWSNHCNVWRQAGATNICVDPCPRCPAINLIVLPDAETANVRQIKFLWALQHTVRMWRVKTSLNTFNATTDTHQKQAILEMIRDHVDCSNPYLFLLIGIFADMHGDKASKAVAAARLAEFGPQFDGKLDFETTKENLDPWMHAAAEGQFGLFNSYGMLDLSKVPRGKPN